MNFRLCSLTLPTQRELCMVWIRIATHCRWRRRGGLSLITKGLGMGAREGISWSLMEVNKCISREALSIPNQIGQLIHKEQGHKATLSLWKEWTWKTHWGILIKWLGQEWLARRICCKTKRREIALQLTVEMSEFWIVNKEPIKLLIQHIVMQITGKMAR